MKTNGKAKKQKAQPYIIDNDVKCHKFDFFHKTS